MKIKVSLKLRALITELQDWNDYPEYPTYSECSFNSVCSKCPFLLFSILFFVSHGCFYSLIIWDKCMLRFIDD